MSKSVKSGKVVEATTTAQEVITLSVESFSIVKPGLYAYDGHNIEVTEVTRDTGRKIHISGTIDGEAIKGADIMTIKRRFGIATKVYNTTGANPGAKVLTDQEISEKVAKFAGSLANCLNGLAKVLNGIGAFTVSFTDNDNNEASAEELATAYRSALLATNEEAKRRQAEARAQKEAREEDKRRKDNAKEVQALMLAGKFAEASALLASLQA